MVDGFPLPHIEELLQPLTGAVYFSKLDRASAYHQDNLSESSSGLTTFVTLDGLIEFRRLCFQLAHAPAVCQKMSDFRKIALEYCATKNTIRSGVEQVLSMMLNYKKH